MATGSYHEFPHTMGKRLIGKTIKRIGPAVDETDGQQYDEGWRIIFADGTYLEFSFNSDEGDDELVIWIE